MSPEEMPPLKFSLRWLYLKWLAWCVQYVYQLWQSLQTLAYAHALREKILSCHSTPIGTNILLWLSTRAYCGICKSHLTQPWHFPFFIRVLGRTDGHIKGHYQRWSSSKTYTPRVHINTPPLNSYLSHPPRRSCLTAHTPSTYLNLSSPIWQHGDIHT